MTTIQESPRKTKPKKGRFASRFANLGCFREFGVFLPGKQGEFTKTQCTDFCEVGLFFQEKHAELTKTLQIREPACESAFLWFGLPGQPLNTAFGASVI